MKNFISNDGFQRLAKLNKSAQEDLDLGSIDKKLNNLYETLYGWRDSIREAMKFYNAGDKESTMRILNDLSEMEVPEFDGFLKQIVNEIAE